MVITKKILFKTKGDTDIINITDDIKDIINKSNITNGIATIFVPGATGGITTIEYEEGLVNDLKEFFESIIPEKHNYHHNIKHSDRNGHSHIRASLMSPSLTVPFIDKKPTLGMWQQIIFIDFDNRARSRELVVQVIGE